MTARLYPFGQTEADSSVPPTLHQDDGGAQVDTDSPITDSDFARLTAPPAPRPSLLRRIVAWVQRS